MNMKVAVEAAKPGVTVGEDMSGLMFVDDFERISKTNREGKGEDSEQKKAPEVVCNEDKLKPVTFKWKWGEDELPIADQYTYLGVEISKNALGMHT